MRDSGLRRRPGCAARSEGGVAIGQAQAGCSEAVASRLELVSADFDQNSVMVFLMQKLAL
jgi:hypothetical protein